MNFWLSFSDIDAAVIVSCSNSAGGLSFFLNVNLCVRTADESLLCTFDDLGSDNFGRMLSALFAVSDLFDCLILSLRGGFNPDVFLFSSVCTFAVLRCAFFRRFCSSFGACHLQP